MLGCQESVGYVCSAGPWLLGSVPHPPLPCCVVLSGCSETTYLCHKQPLLSLLGGAEVRDTWKEGLGNKYKDHSALREPAVSQGTKLTVGCRGFCLLPAHHLSSKVPQPPPGPETIGKSGFRQRPSDWTRSGHF